MINSFDIQPKIDKVNPNYSNSLTSLYISDIYYARTEKRTYFILNRIYAFYTDDDFETVNEIEEINKWFGDLVSTARQRINYMTETMEKTMMFVGISWRKTDEENPTSATDWSAENRGFVWRKEKGNSDFVAKAVQTPRWNDSSTSCIDAGYIGDDVPIVAFTNYTKELWYSLDDGHTWDVFVFSQLRDHFHEVYINKAPHKGRGKGRLWAATGDDFNAIENENSGVVVWDTLDHEDKITLNNCKWVFKDRPGYRIVGITGNFNHVYGGNEASAGGMLKIAQNDHSIDDKEWEYCLGRNRFDFHQFRTVIATDDGLLFSATDSYARAETRHKSHGGYIYISQDEGATFREIPIMSTGWVTSATYTGDAFYFVGDRLDTQNLNVFKLTKQDILSYPRQNYIAKSPFVENGDGSTPLTLKVNDWYKPIVDMSDYDDINVLIETQGKGVVEIQASKFYTDPNWHSQGDTEGWQTIRRIKFNRPERKDIHLTDSDRHHKLYRVIAVDGDVSIKHLIYTGKGIRN